jgi:threonine/homoserine/homoserine lactone efflux protein
LTDHQLGIATGGIIMMLLSLVACLAMVKFYDWSKRDWLGIEELKELKEYSGASNAGRLTAWVLRRSEPVIFLFLSIKADPFITMTYLRHGAFNRMKRRDWAILVGSVAVGNAYWAVACWLGISVVEWLWRVVTG